jgi:hypothetical protein
VPICCAAVSNISEYPSRGVGHGIKDDLDYQKKFNYDCSVTKEYYPSTYERENFEFAYNLSKIEDLNVRSSKFLEFVLSEAQIIHSISWLKEVMLHMMSEGVPVEHDPKTTLLSRFRVAKKCRSGEEYVWDEWIEPITLHARHPFSLRNCNQESQRILGRYPSIRVKGLQNVDYVLLTSGKIFYNNSSPNRGQTLGNPNKHKFYDAGSSDFYSGQRWFLCAYSRRFISFDDIYGWELTLLEPTKFWDNVPPKWIPYYHFFNVPISKNIEDKNSPLRFIVESSHVDDFISFKLDIDSSDVENGVVDSILTDPKIYTLIDEFFFEPHFSICGYSNGDKITRLEGMETIKQLRMRGVRSHFWP